ncbi:MAG: hypothetical protein IJ007_00600 [Oscillospiraceae bacterium]|nr:hypothetical protein [Oscillospiraceae bacterium]
MTILTALVMFTSCTKDINVDTALQTTANMYSTDKELFSIVNICSADDYQGNLPFELTGRDLDGITVYFVRTKDYTDNNKLPIAMASSDGDIHFNGANIFIEDQSGEFLGYVKTNTGVISERN